MKKIFKFSDEFHGPGSIYFSWQKGHNAKYLVTTGNDQIVNLHDKYGNKIDSFNLSGTCCGLEWNKNGDLLAIITDRSSVIKIWNSNHKKVINVDFGVKESLNFIFWSIQMPNLLAITTVTGNLLIYDHNTSRKIPIMGKHSKKILSGCWTIQNLLVLVCEDRYLSISDESGDTVFQTNLKAKGSLIKSSLKPIEFSNVKSETNPAPLESHCISVVLNRKQIIILLVNSLDQPLVLSFEERYEEILDYYWQSNGQLLIAFTSGFIINVQTSGNQLGQELAFVKVFPDTISNLSLCESTGNLAVIHKNIIKLMNAQNLENIENVYVVEDEQELEWLEWSANGQMLAVSSSAGNLDIFLVKLLNVSCTYQTKIAYLSSLLEISYVDIEQEKLDQKNRNQIQLNIEPTLVAIGNSHLATCMNNRAFFYELNTYRNGKMLPSDGLGLIKEKEYSSIVKSMFMNDQYAAILFTDNKAILHRIPQLEDYIEEDEDFVAVKTGSPKDFYQVDTKLTIVCIALTNNFFIWCTDAGILEMFSIEEWTTVSIHRHVKKKKKKEIKKKDENNTDELDDLSSINYEDLPTDHIVVGQRNYTQTFPLRVISLFWDLVDHSVFAVMDRKQILIYYYVVKSVQGSFVQLIGKHSLDENITPLLLYNGLIYFQSSTGNLSFKQLETHNYTSVLSKSKNNDKKLSKREQVFRNLLKLRRTADCWLLCKTMNRIEFWLQFVDCCLHDLMLGEAIRIARYIGHAGIVWSLKSIQKIEEWSLLAGHVAMYLQWFDLAEKLYLKSTQPTCALKLRLDLMQWNTCLVLAKRLASDQLPFIHKQQAHELEFEENFNQAIDHFQDGLLEKSDQHAKHNQECLAGISRCLLRCGDSRKGVQIAMKLNDPGMVRQTAVVCEECNLLNEAANLYEKIGEFENACLLYLKTRNLSKVKELLQQSKNQDWPKKTILIHYGKLQEQEGKFADAFRAYEQTDQQLDCVRLLLDKLNRPQEAVRLIRQQRITSFNSSTEACLLIAKHFQQINDYESAIEFLVYSGKLEEAFTLALQESQMPLYTNALLQVPKNSTGESSSAKFPKHAAQILSTTVVECLKLNNKTQAIHFSNVLIQNSSYMEQLDAKFRRKIETLIRKSASTARRDNAKDANQEIKDETLCPFCRNLLPKFQLSCNSCRAVIPFSILTGYHLTDDNEESFHCNFCYLPFMLSEFNTFLEPHCPACSNKLERDCITKLESLALVS